MNAIGGFLRKYDAVPADRHGCPQFGPADADDATVIRWAESQVAAWDAGRPEDRAELLPVLKDLRRQTWLRPQRLPLGDPTRRRLASAWMRLVDRIGFGGDE
jgi:hypothetical protein